MWTSEFSSCFVLYFLLLWPAFILLPSNFFFKFPCLLSAVNCTFFSLSPESHSLLSTLNPSYISGENTVSLALMVFSIITQASFITQIQSYFLLQWWKFSINLADFRQNRLYFNAFFFFFCQGKLASVWIVIIEKNVILE